MINQKPCNFQMPNEAEAAFKELEITKHLREAGISKSFGFTCSYLFRLVFCLIFQQRNWFSLLQSKRAGDLPGKDTVYRFLDQSTFNWRRFLLSLSSSAIRKVDRLTGQDRRKVLIVDDSAYRRDRSKKVELLARLYDHASGGYYKGFKMLTLGWSDGMTFLPVDFTLQSSKKTENGIAEKLDKRTSGYKRRKEAIEKSTDLLPQMVRRALHAGIEAEFLLMDSWFTMPALIKNVLAEGIGVIGMVKKNKTRYFVEGKPVDLTGLYQLARRQEGQFGILRSILCELSDGIQVKMVFVQNKNKKSDWLAILSTDCTLSEKEIIKIYGMRWDIEVFFKTAKSLLNLAKEFQVRSYGSLIGHTTIVFTRFIVLSWQHRNEADPRTLGGLFYELCDEIDYLDWACALQELIGFLKDALKKTGRQTRNLIQKQVLHWMEGLPCYIRAYLPISLCES
ncbi:transposase [Sporosarcina oncorhynchi]|uniref:Transposase n=1 Tax=Sporosarcina oncorhynchi TaxID=3056444 RepID=A0ABZ0L311_9BACL|nr:transposase [Sporosarcina sp. T2O-4]WOV86995.1 transposase [Sporosarcina sp. T2O-4]